MRTRCWFVVILVTSVSVAGAQDEPESPECLRAQQHIGQGDRLRAQHQCAEAIVEYEAGLRLCPIPQALENLSTCEVDLGLLERALEHVEELAELAPDHPRLEEMASWLRDRLGAVRIESSVPAEVWFDNRLLGQAPGTFRLPLGRRAIEIVAPGHLPRRMEVTVTHDQEQQLNVTLERLPEPIVVPAPVPPGDQLAPPLPHPVARDPVDDGEDGLAPPLFGTSVAGTAAAALVAAAFGIHMRRLVNEAEDTDPWAADLLEDLQQRIDDASLRANIMWGVTAALGIASTILYFFTDFGGPPQEDDADEALEVGIRPDGFSLAWR